MKIYIIGADNKYAIEKPYMQYIAKHADVQKVYFFAAQNRFLAYYNKSILHKIIYRVGLTSILKKINKELVEEVRKVMPDIILVFKGMEIFPETLQYFRQLRIKLVNYNPDNPFIFSGRGSGNKNITNSISLYDLHFTYDKTVQQQIKLKYSIPCEILPFGFDISEELYEQCVQEKEIVKTCFLGTPDKMRANFINALLNRGLEIDLYGNGWHKFITNSKATIYAAVYGAELWKTLRKYRVQLNIMRLHNPTSHNMRSFEVPGIGGIMLAPDTIDHRMYFKVGEEIFLYSSIDECVIQIQTLLQKEAMEANTIREKVRHRSVISGYSYKHRAAYLIQVLNELIAK